MEKNKSIQKCIKLIEENKITFADNILTQILIKNNNDFDALYLKGVILGMQERHHECTEYLKKAEKINPNNGFLQFNLAKALSKIGEEELAVKHHEYAVRLIPNYPEARINLAKSYYKLTNIEEALNVAEKIIQISPEYKHAYYFLLKLNEEINRTKEALKWIEIIIQKFPGSAEDFFLHGNVLVQENKLEKAVISYNKALEINPNFVEAYFNRGNALMNLDKPDQAIECFDKLININPNYLDAYLNRGFALMELNKVDEALACYEKLKELNPSYAEVYNNCSNIYLNYGEIDAALKNNSLAIKLKPNLPEAYLTKGNIFLELKEFEESIKCYDYALQLEPNNSNVVMHLGILYSKLYKYNDAILFFEKAIQLEPSNKEIYHKFGDLFTIMGDTAKAKVNYKKALLINPFGNFIYSSYLRSKMATAEWNNISDECEKLEDLIKTNRILVNPFEILNLIDNVEVIKKAAIHYTSVKYNKKSNPESLPKKSINKKIKIAYLSADFKEHPMMYNFIGFFEKLDRERFEVIAVSFLPISDNTVTKRMIAAFDLIKIVDNLSDIEVCKWIRNQDIDIAVDMMGHTRDSRQAIFAMRCAQIQINQFSWTSGAQYMDYIIADDISIPKDLAHGYTEKVVYVPNTLFATDDKREIDSVIPQKKEENLPEEGIIFCCFNNTNKITPMIFSIWMRILHKVDKSVLWMRGTGDEMENNLRNEAEKACIDPERLVFAAKTPSMAKHLARYKLADLFLDTYPFCAQTTASDALWAGIPVVTCTGESSMSRICASMLHTLGFPELVTNSFSEYESKILDLVKDPTLLQKIKQRIIIQKEASPLFKTSLYTRNIENVYLNIIENSRESNSV